MAPLAMAARAGRRPGLRSFAPHPTLMQHLFEGSPLANRHRAGGGVGAS
jgi:hypothetical protein